jgi:hypothetical protein
MKVYRLYHVEKCLKLQVILKLNQNQLILIHLSLFVKIAYFMVSDLYELFFGYEDKLKFL